MSAHLKRITNEAKRLRRSHPNMKWTSLVKMASKKIKGKVAGKKVRKKVGAYKVVERGESRSARPSNVYMVKRAKSGTFKGASKLTGVSTTVTGLLGQAREILMNRLGKLEAKKFVTPLKRDKNKLQKEITQVKSQLRKFKK